MAVSGTGSVAVAADTSYGHIATNVDTVEEVASIEMSTEAKVREYFSDIPVLIQVARCESTFRHTLADGSVLKGKVDSRDTGVMQINTYYHAAQASKLGLDLEILEDNMAYARNLYERQGTQPWSASAPCWSGHVATAQ
jgi:hypothetical protein